MQKLLLSVFLVLFGASFAHASAISNTDLWQYTNIQSISSSGVHPLSDVRGMFGGSFAPVEPVQTIFPDDKDDGYNHWIQWTLYSPSTVTDINLVIAHDGAPFNMNHRGISHFKLEAYIGSQWVTVFDTDIEQKTYGSYYPVYGGSTHYPDYNFLEVEASIAQTTAQTWRASFTQFGDISVAASGPRILELDGIYTAPPPVVPVPEPSTIILCLSALVLCVKRLRR
ncbi:MAG: hypothetical protein AB1454_03225 [Candidatus Auribacterota bacterium]